MPQFRDALPQLDGHPFLAEGGIGTTLMYKENIDLPCFAHFPLVCTDEGRATLTRFFEPHLELAKRYRVGMILDTLTWRANADWGTQLGYDAQALAEVNRTAVRFVEALWRQHAQADLPLVLNGVIGPRGD